MLRTRLRVKRSHMRLDQIRNEKRTKKDGKKGTLTI
jgi:hypothetical protein